MTWSKVGQAAIPGRDTIGFARAMPPEVKPKPKPKPASIPTIPSLGLKADPYA